MGWPFSNVGAPNFDTLPGQPVPVTPTEVTLDPVWLLGAHFQNSALATRTVTVVDADGDTLCKLKVPPGAEQPYDWAFRPAVGVTWSADGVGLTGHLWGYQ